MELMPCRTMSKGRETVITAAKRTEKMSHTSDHQKSQLNILEFPVFSNDEQQSSRALSLDSSQLN